MKKIMGKFINSDLLNMMEIIKKLEFGRWSIGFVDEFSPVGNEPGTVF
jgi:hypothetical protein